MTDMEKVRQGVWQCLLDNTEEEYETQCLDCPYYSEGIMLKECKTQLRKDFTELLKEQKRGRWTTHRTQEHDGEWYCDQCGYEPTIFEATPYCPNCGAMMF